VKLTFEGDTLDDILNQMDATLEESFLRRLRGQAPAASAPEKPAKQKAQGPSPEPSPEVIPEVIPVREILDAGAPKKPRTAKQLANDARLGAAAQARLAEAKAQPKKAAKPAKAAPVEAAPEPKQQPLPLPPTLKEPGQPLDPAEIVAIRQKTIDDLQAAYANGFQKEVFELLSRFGNGAKSFRELPPDAFVPIREAIDHGALS